MIEPKNIYVTTLSEQIQETENMDNENGNRTWTVKLNNQKKFECNSLQKCAWWVNNSHYLRMNPDTRISISSFVTGASE